MRRTIDEQIKLAEIIQKYDQEGKSMKWISEKVGLVPSTINKYKMSYRIRQLCLIMNIPTQNIGNSSLILLTDKEENILKYRDLIIRYNNRLITGMTRIEFILELKNPVKQIIEPQMILNDVVDSGTRSMDREEDLRRRIFKKGDELKRLVNVDRIFAEYNGYFSLYHWIREPWIPSLIEYFNIQLDKLNKKIKESFLYSTNEQEQQKQQKIKEVIDINEKFKIQ